MDLERKTLKILLVEDDPGDAGLVKLALSGQPTQTLIAEAGSLAEALLFKNQGQEADVILLDLSLPDSRGFATVAAIRAAFPITPIVVLTGLDDPSVENVTVASGAQDYLLKGSFDGQSLMRALRHAMVRQQLEQSLVESEARHRTLVNLAPDAILLLSPRLLVLSANSAGERIFGASRVGGLEGILTSDILPEIKEILAANPDLTVIRRDGRGLRAGLLFPVAMAIARLGDGCLLVMATDITDRMQLVGELHELARTDVLTGLPNRRAFIESIETEFRRCCRFGLVAAVLMIDIDHFKQVNDARGHEAGDQALASLGGILKKLARATDLPARFGGEEFVLLLPETDLEGGVEMAERIRSAVALHQVDSLVGKFGFTVSIGAAVLTHHDQHWSAAIRRADQGMYKAKASGRNAVVASGSDCPGLAPDFERSVIT